MMMNLRHLRSAGRGVNLCNVSGHNVDGPARVLGP